MNVKPSYLEKIIENNVYFKSSESMYDIKSESIQSIITSPPYWNLKDYGEENQIGFGESYELYQNRLNKVWLECKRVLSKNGTMWIVIDKLWRNRAVINIPLHIAMNCKNMGYYLKDMIIWNKPTAIAGMHKKNLVNKYETIIFLTKDNTKYKLNYEIMNGETRPDFFQNQLTNLWRISVKSGVLRKTPNHKAPYPLELVERMLLLSTDNSDTVLDPFLGSGTTMRVALQHHRKCKGYEINPNFKLEILEQLKALPHSIFQTEIGKFL